MHTSGPLQVLTNIWTTCSNWMYAAPWRPPAFHRAWRMCIPPCHGVSVIKVLSLTPTSVFGTTWPRNAVRGKVLAYWTPVRCIRCIPAKQASGVSLWICSHQRPRVSKMGSSYPSVPCLMPRYGMWHEQWQPKADGPAGTCQLGSGPGENIHASLIRAIGWGLTRSSSHLPQCNIPVGPFMVGQLS